MCHLIVDGLEKLNVHILSAVKGPVTFYRIWQRCEIRILILGVRISIHWNVFHGLFILRVGCSSSGVYCTKKLRLGIMIHNISEKLVGYMKDIRKVFRIWISDIKILSCLLCLYIRSKKCFWFFNSMFRIWLFGYCFGYPKCFSELLWRFA